MYDIYFAFWIEYARFFECCQRAYDAALQLASWAANVSKDSLKRYYEESCEVSWFQTMQQSVPLFEDGESSEEENEKRARNPWLDTPFSFILILLILGCFRTLTGCGMKRVSGSLETSGNLRAIARTCSYAWVWTCPGMSRNSAIICWTTWLSLWRRTIHRRWPNHRTKILTCGDLTRMTGKTSWKGSKKTARNQRGGQLTTDCHGHLGWPCSLVVIQTVWKCFEVCSMVVYCCLMLVVPKGGVRCPWLGVWGSLVAPSGTIFTGFAISSGLRQMDVTRLGLTKPSADEDHLAGFRKTCRRWRQRRWGQRPLCGKGLGLLDLHGGSSRASFWGRSSRSTGHSLLPSSNLPCFTFCLILFVSVYVLDILVKWFKMV